METAKETVTNIVNAASNMIYGETDKSATAGTGSTEQHSSSLLGDGTSSSTGNVTGGQEPLSGKTGAGTANQPYDAGNTTGEPTNTTSTSTTASSGPETSSNPNATTTGTSSSEADVVKSSATANTAQDVGSAPPESGAGPSAKQQGAANPKDEPDAAQSEAISDKNTAADETLEGGSSSGQTGTDSSSAGPKPLDGGSGSTSAQDKEKEALGSTSKEPGTGEKYIKSSGVQADGGDFDAANAGAGREADRLLEEKGIHREGGNTGEPQAIPGQKAAAQSAAGEKPSLGQKLKDKLHIGSKDKP